MFLHPCHMPFVCRVSDSLVFGDAQEQAFFLPSPLCAPCALLSHTSRLAPMARTLLGGLEHAMSNFSVVAARLLFVFASIRLRCCCWSAHKSLVPRSRTLLGVLGQATLNFVAVATLLFFFFCDCPKFCDLAKQRLRIFGGVSEVGKIDFALFFFRLCIFFLVFFFKSKALCNRGKNSFATHTVL